MFSYPDINWPDVYPTDRWPTQTLPPSIQEWPSSDGLLDGGMPDSVFSAPDNLGKVS